MSKMDEVRQAMMQAMKERDKARKDALSMLLSSLKAQWIDKRADLTEEEENAVVLKEIKQAQETLESAPADHTELIETCRTRIAVYREFAPKQLTEEEIRQAVTEVLAALGIAAPTVRDKGAVMKQLMPRVKWKADGGLVNRVVESILTA